MNQNQQLRTWAIYRNDSEMLADIEDEGDDVTGLAIGSNWQPGYTREEAESALSDLLALGYGRGHSHSSRY